MRVYLVDTKEFPVLGTHRFTSKKLLDGFEHLGHEVKEITVFDMEDDEDNIFIMSNHCYIRHDKHVIESRLEELSKKYIKSTFILWFYHTLAAANKIPFKRWILTGECFYDQPKSVEHMGYYDYQNTIKNYVPWRFAVSSSIEDIQKELENLESKEIEYNACFMGTRYKPDWSRGDKIYYYDNSSGFLDEKERVRVFKSSLIALGWHADANIENNVVVERVFEGMRYGCVVITDNPIAEQITDGICEYVKSPQEVQQKIKHYLDNPDKRLEKVRRGLEWLIEKGTYSHVAMDFIKKMNSWKRVLITGGCGFVGRHFTKRLINDGYKVVCVDNLVSESAKHPNQWFNECDNFIFINQDCRDYLKDCREEYDIVIHLAAIVGGRSNMENHPMSVAEDLSIDASFFTWIVKNKENIKHVIYFSSSAAYPIEYQQNDSNKKVLSESMIDLEGMNIGKPDLTYGWSKLTGEYLARVCKEQYSIKIAIYRPFSGYGEDQDEVYPFIGILKRVMRRESPIEIWNDSIRDFVHVDDIVDYVMDSYRVCNNDINIGTGIGISFSDLAKRMMRIYGHEAEIKVLNDKPKGVYYRVAEKGINTKISLDKGIKMAIEFQNHLKDV